MDKLEYIKIKDEEEKIKFYFEIGKTIAIVSFISFILIKIFLVIL